MHKNEHLIDLIFKLKIKQNYIKVSDMVNKNIYK